MGPLPAIEASSSDIPEPDENGNVVLSSESAIRLARTLAALSNYLLTYYPRCRASEEEAPAL